MNDDVLLRIALTESIDSIDKLCQTSTRFNNLICNNNNFWRQKFVNNFGLPSTNIVNWKDAYQNFGRVVVCGDNESGQLGLGPNSSIRNELKSVNYRAKSIVCGDSHTVIIDLNDNVWMFGRNNFGQLGLGDDENRNKPTVLTIDGQNFKARAISCGRFHTMLIDLNDSVWTFGDNTYGQLGLNDDRIRSTPNALNLKAKAISCGTDHAVIIDLNDNIWVVGGNSRGQLGLNDAVNRYTPTALNFKAKFASCGFKYTILIDLNNNVWAFGLNNYGALGLGDNIHRNVPIQIPDIKAKFVSCGDKYTILIELNNNILAFGSNFDGQLGLGDNISRNVPTQIPNIKAKTVSCGARHTVIIDFNDNVWSFGYNNFRQLGFIDRNSRNLPTQIPDVKARSVSCGGFHTMIILQSPLQFTDNVHLIPFNEIVKKLDSGEILKFDFLPEYQTIPHNPSNFIASFYGKDGNIYLVDLKYDQILPPV
jgi:alpha-tubulin suppressor-like RCC1 family protein